MNFKITDLILEQDKDAIFVFIAYRHKLSIL
ncbi:MAG: hypothetical protein PWP53_4264 [Lacrimispora sp.]|jgi:hypothetical protein|nr:hypothetical protein [Lacrimispora sp.]